MGLGTLGSEWKLGRSPWSHVTLQVPELLLGLSGSETAVVYYEQGHEWLFGDPARLPTVPQGVQTTAVTTSAEAAAFATSSVVAMSSPVAAWDRVFHMVMGLPCVLATVSETARAILAAEFGRGKALLVPNGVDAEAAGGFRPSWQEEKEDAALSGVKEAAEAASAACRGCSGLGLTTSGPGTAAGAWVEAGLPAPTQIFGSSEVMLGSPLPLSISPLLFHTRPMGSI